MPQKTKNSTYTIVRKVSEFGRNHHIFQSIRDIIAIIALIGSIIGYAILLSYCIQNNVPFFEAAIDMGIYVAVLSILMIGFIALVALIFIYPAWIRNYDGFTARLKALEYRENSEHYSTSSMPKSHWVNVSRGFTLGGFALIGLFITFALLLQDNWPSFSFVLWAFTVIAMGIMIWSYGFLFYSGILRIKRVVRTKNGFLKRSFFKILSENGIGTTILINCYIAIMMITCAKVGINKIKEIYPKFGHVDNNQILDAFIFASILAVAILPFLAAMRVFNQSFCKTFFFTAGITCFVIITSLPGLSILSKNMMAMTSKGGDIPVRILVKKNVACSIGKETIFKSIDWDTLECRKLSKKEDLLIYSDVVFLALRTSNAVYVRSKKGGSPIYFIKFPTDGMMEYQAMTKPENDTKKMEW
ncbi:hypothetical protein [Kiloniella litopenaei]|uniref:hypothetical protein n=1 Tax=Kiloniella litopenaei TaxID=1549748 RepID=UPI003BA8754E